jgi:hypothetical protein
MKQAPKRTKDVAVTNPSFKRTVSFVEKVIATENIGYLTPIRSPRQFLMGSFVNEF